MPASLYHLLKLTMTVGLQCKVGCEEMQLNPLPEKVYVVSTIPSNLYRYHEWQECKKTTTAMYLVTIEPKQFITEIL